jgi:hypothetical protein
VDKKIADVLRVSMGPALSLLYLPLLYLDEAQRFELILSRLIPIIILNTNWIRFSLNFV